MGWKGKGNDSVEKRSTEAYMRRDIDSDHCRVLLLSPPRDMHSDIKWYHIINTKKYHPKMLPLVQEKKLATTTVEVLGW